MSKNVSKTYPTRQYLKWFAEWENFLKTENFNQGLLSILHKLEEMRLRQVFDEALPLSEVKKNAVQFVRYYTLFIGRADIDLLSQQYNLLCKIKLSLGSLIDAAELDGLEPVKIWQKFIEKQCADDPDLLRALALVTLSNVHLYPGESITKIDPQLIAPLALHCLAQRYTLTKQQTQNKKALISISNYYEDMKFPGYHATNMSLAWMYCSYLHWNKKHELKKTINKLYVRWMTEKRLIETKPTRPRLTKPKPTLVIFAEVFSDNHAMFRCHGASAAVLKSRFRTILITDLTGLSPTKRSLFSKTIQLDSSARCVDKNLRKIRGLYPDIIYYPSIGMNRNAIYLCNLRLAPIQLMSMGHPASSFSKEMDYVVVNNDLRPDPACFSEKIIHRRQSAGYAKVPHWTRQKLAPSTVPPTGKLRVGILGYLPKVTFEFLQLCLALEKNCSNGLEFHFFPNNVTVDFHGFKRCVTSMLSSSIFHAHTTYGKYMNEVNALDMVLTTFPFGNTNGTVDALLARKPILALDGPEPHSKTDPRLLRKVGAPEEMITNSLQDFYATALNWLSNPAKLDQVTQAIEQLDIEGILFSTEEKSDFDEVVSLIYDVHENLQSDSRREFEYGDLVEMKSAAET